jgi:hypothetical protein
MCSQNKKKLIRDDGEKEGEREEKTFSNILPRFFFPSFTARERGKAKESRSRSFKKNEFFCCPSGEWSSCVEERD